MILHFYLQKYLQGIFSVVASTNEDESSKPEAKSNLP